MMASKKLLPVVILEYDDRIIERLTDKHST